MKTASAFTYFNVLSFVSVQLALNTPCACGSIWSPPHLESELAENIVGKGHELPSVKTIKPDDALEEARRAAFDLSLLDSNLALTPQERALRHESALELMLA
ncbi:hypothetical protein CMV30_10450 [Nibricoccus aquaticus]|uniref:Uncharacterized protein n=1 Tax=Nibricoccus aquaticus TaxID=2576891 RepID=A0A290QJ29_9BACT|nr:hypothetical protein [Nibricoccus aquaticus]ATC64341.1 hypothetical protein CMV30_10450 [Nibricoccus aquaticus]